VARFNQGLTERCCCPLKGEHISRTRTTPFEGKPDCRAYPRPELGTNRRQPNGSVLLGAAPKSYGNRPGVPIGGGALSGKDPHKVDKCGAQGARQLAKKLVRQGVDEAQVILGWAPGGGAPFLIEASTSQGGVNLQVPRNELPAEEWFTIRSIVRDLELCERDWAVDLLAGYLCQPLAPWAR
jgi:S-adenosylmethionine synthetase, C-terminal domain